jgi:hypothetical protein
MSDMVAFVSVRVAGYRRAAATAACERRGSAPPSTLPLATSTVIAAA